MGKLFEDEYRFPFTGDYRHVVVTRNWYDAIISGYLYHKSCKERWLDWFGESITMVGFGTIPRKIGNNDYCVTIVL